MHTRPLNASDISALGEIAALAEAEGFRFVTRFLGDLELGRVRLDAECEFFLATLLGDEIVAIGGVTPDPYVDDAVVGRLRHLYVRPNQRQMGIGRTLVERLERRAASCYTHLRLRTDNPAAAAFYECLGYAALASESATHQRGLRGVRTLTKPSTIAAPAV
jgi:GNAT superfamily N-acetyltransferase